VPAHQIFLLRQAEPAEEFVEYRHVLLAAVRDAEEIRSIRGNPSEAVKGAGFRAPGIDNSKEANP
jgi:hypothetical protein